MKTKLLTQKDMHIGKTGVYNGSRDCLQVLVQTVTVTCSHAILKM